MDNTELLDLIAKGKTEDLLQQKNFTMRLNSLAAIGVIDICGGKILVTPKGEQLQKKRELKRLETLKVQKDLEKFSSSNCRRNSLYIYLSLVLLCTAAVFLSIIIVQGQ
ncbi:MAG TPA: hypothetical protein VLN46_04610 [Gillisia sp.]|nr:hypothetical protein [Gillisia sp.]